MKKTSYGTLDKILCYLLYDGDDQQAGNIFKKALKTASKFFTIKTY